MKKNKTVEASNSVSVVAVSNAHYMKEEKDADPRANKIVFHTTTLNGDYNRIEADKFKIGWFTIKFYVDDKLIAMYPKNSTIIKRIVYPS